MNLFAFFRLIAHRSKCRQMLLGVLLVCCLALQALAVTGPGDWSMFHHDRQHTGRSPFIGSALPSLKWHLFATKGAVVSSPALGADGTIYVGSNDQNLYALNADGSQKWAFPTTGVIYASPAIGADGTVYIGSTDGNLYAINPDGTKKWTFNTNSPLYASPVLGTDGSIYIGALNYKSAAYCGQFYAINPDGSQKWASAVNGGFYSAAAIGTDGTIYVGSYDDNLYAITPDGTQKWAFATGSYINASSPAIGVDGTIYVGSEDAYLYAVNPNGTQKWTLTCGENAANSPAIGADGTIYVSLSGKLTALNPDSTKKWAFDTKGYSYGGAAIGADGVVYVGVDTNLLAVNPNGTQKWIVATGNAVESSPAIGADGTVYIGSDDSCLYAIGPSSAPILSLTKSVTPAYPRPGDTVTYTLNCANLSSTAASNVTITDKLPAGLTFVSGGTFNATSTTVTWSLGKLNALATAQAVTCIATVNADVANATNIANTAVVFCTEVPTPVVSNAAGLTVYLLTLTPTAGTNGVINPNVLQYVSYGSAFTFTATANAGYTVDSWSLDGTPVQLGGAGLTLRNIITNHTVKVTFKLPTSAGPKRGDWWMFHHDAQHTGRSPFIGSAVPKLKWACVTGDAIFSSPAIGADGTIYVGSNDGNLYAVNPNGSKKLMTKMNIGTGYGSNVGSNSQVQSSPAIGLDGNIYVGAGNTLDAVTATGGVLWSWCNTQYMNYFPAIASPVIGADGKVYECWEQEQIHAFTAAGKVAWNNSNWGGGDSSPVLGTDGTVYFSGIFGGIMGCGPTGTAIWNAETGPTSISSPAIGPDGTLYVGAGDGSLYAVNPDGSIKWTFLTGAFIASSPAIGADGTIYVGSRDGNLYAVKADGTKKWAFTTGDFVDSSPAIGGDGVIYVGSDDGNIYAVNPDGTQKWVYATGNWVRSSPAIGADGTIYVGSYDHKLYAIGGPATTCTVTPSAGTNGTITPSTVQTVNYGANLTFTATANAAYTVDTWQLDGASAQTGGVKYTLTNIIANHTVKVTFKLTNPPAPGDWWMFHHDAQHTGRSAFSGPAHGAVKWTFAMGLGGTVSLSAAIGPDGTIYTGSNDKNLYAVNPDGSMKWYLPTGGTVTAPAIGADGTIYAGSQDCKLYAVNANGITKWTAYTGAAIQSSPTIGPDGVIYLGSNDSYLHAFNPDGSQKWVFPTLDGIYTSPALGIDGTIYFMSDDGMTMYLTAVNPDGTLKWANALSEAYWSLLNPSPAVGPDGVIYCSGTGYSLFAVNPDGSTRWSFTTSGSVRTCPAIGTDGTIYFGSADNNLYAVNADGTQKWAYATGSQVFSSPAIDADGTVYVGSQDKNLYALTSAGTQKWSLALGGSIGYISPSIGADGTLYLGNNLGGLFAIANGTPSPVSANQPDVTICNFGDRGYLGQGIINADGGGQTKSQSVAPNVPAHYFINVQNVGQTADTFILTCPGVAAGWKAQFVDWNTGYDVSTAFNGTGFKTVLLTPGNSTYFTLHITPTNTVAATSTAALKITAVSAGDTSKLDAVKAVTTVLMSYQPDLAVCNASDTAYIGLGIINQSGANQTKSQVTVNGTAANYYVQVKNAGNTSDTFTLTCPPVPTGWTIQFVDQSNGKDVTAAFIGTGQKQTLAAGTWNKFTIHLTAGPTVSGTLSLAITAVSGADKTKTDVVKAATTIPLVIQPDQAIENYGDASYTGLGILNLDGTNQTKSQTVATGTVTTYLFEVKNNGNTADTFTLTCPLPGTSGWTVQFVDRGTGKDITTAITSTNGINTLSLAGGAIALYTLHVTPGAAAIAGAPYTLAITATSITDKTKQDVVKATTTKQNATKK